MEIIIQDNKTTASSLAAKVIVSQIKQKPNSVLGMATGNTQLLLYKELIRLYKNGLVDFSEITAFNLDEYIGLDPNHPSSYHSYMWNNFFNHINIKNHRVHIPNGIAPDIDEHCKQYEGAIKASDGIDLQLLGLGADGHIGFNEPTSSLSSRTRIKTLTKKTIEDNAPLFDNENEMPRHVITMGVGTIMESKICLLLAFGEQKAEALRQTVEGAICSNVPASILQMHPRTIIIADEEAASKLDRKDYYKWVYSNKPDWQKIK
jgi:glucosamine-6-phosphate deaminase